MKTFQKRPEHFNASDPKIWKPMIINLVTNIDSARFLKCI